MLEPSSEGIFFADRLSEFGERAALISEDGTIFTYLELVQAADLFAEKLGSTPKLLLLECPNDRNSLIAYVGALRGRHPVILTSNSHSGDIERLKLNYAPDATYQCLDGAWVLDVRSSSHKLHPNLAVMLSTSGTTGATKLVRLSRQNLDANARSIASYLGIEGDDRAIMSLPFHYSYGLSVVNSHLASGASIILTERSVIEDEFWQVFTAQNATSLAGVPYTYELLERINFGQKNLPSLRTLTQAGGRLPADLAKKYSQTCTARGIRFFVMYGQTEATARMAYMPPEMLSEKADCIGVPIPGGEFTLLDENGKVVVDVNLTGELVYRGPNVMMGYAETSLDLQKGAELDALVTGDLAQRDHDGFYKIVGRKSRFSKLFGLRIALDEVEAKLRLKGYTGAVAGNDEIIAVVLTGDADAIEAKAFLSEQFAIPLTSFDVITSHDLPLLPSGKIAYRKILEDALKRKSELSALPPRRDVRTLFSLALPGRKVTENDTFVSLGGDSLSFISILSQLDGIIDELPQEWEKMTIAELQQLTSNPKDKKKTASAIKSIAPDMFLRAIAISSIVFNHVTKLGGGGVDVMLLLMGVSLMRFQYARLLSPNRWNIAVDMALKLIIPYYVILILYTLVFGKNIQINFLDYILLGNYREHGWTLQQYWFILGYFQSIIIILLVVSVPKMRELLINRPVAATFSALSISVAVKMFSMPLFHPQQLLGNVPSVFTGHGVDQFFYIAALGACIFFAKTPKLKAIIFVFSILFAALTATKAIPWWRGFDGPMRGPSLVIGTWILLYTSAIPLPNFIRKVLMEVGSSSFAIYISHVLLLIVYRWLIAHHKIEESFSVEICAALLLIAAGVLISKFTSKIPQILKATIENMNRKIMHSP